MEDKTLFYAALACSFVGLLFLSYLAYFPLSNLEGPFRVTRVVDGDTIDLDNGKRVRLSGISAAESGTCFAQEATKKLEALVLDKDVFLERDIEDEGKYGRILRYVYVEKVLVNEILVAEGFVKVYDKYNRTTKKYKQLKRAEREPKRDSIGIWSCDDFLDCLYVANKDSLIYHKPECSAARKIKEENRVCITSVSQLEKYVPAKRC